MVTSHSHFPHVPDCSNKISLLGKGQNFVISSKLPNVKQVKEDVAKFIINFVIKMTIKITQTNFNPKEFSHRKITPIGLEMTNLTLRLKKRQRK